MTADLARVAKHLHGTGVARRLQAGLGFSAQSMSDRRPEISITRRLAALSGEPGSCRRACLVVLALSLASCLQAAETSISSRTSDLTELPLEALMEIEVPTVYGASKFEQKITEAPSSVTVVYAEEIKRYGYRTLADVLQSVQGFQVSYDRNYSFLGTRGINLGDFNSRVLLTVDGHRVNNDLTDGAAIGNDFILDIDLVDRVEVIRGPFAVLYGNNAFFGVINVVTRKAAQLNGFEVSGEYGSFDTYKARLSFGKAFTNGMELLLSGSFYDSAGSDQLFYKEFNTPAQNYGVASGLDGEEYANCFGSLGYRDFKLEGAFIWRQKDNPTAQFFTRFDDGRLNTVNEQSFVNLKYAHEFPDVVDVTAQVHYDQNDFDIGYPFGSVPAISFFKETQNGQWWGAELELNKRVWDKHVVTVGAEYRDDFWQNDRVFDPETQQTYSDNHQTRQSYGFFGQVDIALRTNLHFNAGLRYDQYGDFEPAWDPRLALIYDPFEKSTLKAIYGTAFRAPSFLELSDPRFQDISPENITTYELVYEQGIGSHLRSSVSGYYNRMDHLIVFDNGNFGNINADGKGLEFALEGIWAGGLRGRMSYSLQQTTDLSSSQYLPDSPEHLIKFNLSVPVYKDKLFVGLEFQYTSSRHTFYTTTSGETVAGVDADGFGVVNLTLFSQKLIKNLEFSASVYNLLDQQYADPATRFHLQDQIARDGRTFRVKLTYRF
jgi:outer membrane receptor for ferrienterochelin and colicins